MTTQLEERIKSQFAGIQEYLQDQQAQGIQPVREELDRIKAQVANLMAMNRELREGRHFHPSNDRPRVRSGKYAGMDSLGLAISRSVLASQLRNPSGLGGDMVRGLQDWERNLKAAMDSTTSSSGDELVPTGEAADLWMDVNLDTMILPLFNRVQMPTNPFDIPLQLGDINWYPGTENVATTSTDLTTAKQTLTAYELVGMVPWSLTLDEDSVISMMDEVRASLVRNASEVIDDVLLNADQTTTNNINADGTTIATTDAGKGHWLLGFDGLIHLPLIDNTSQANDHNDAVTDDMWNEIRSKLGKYGARPSELAFITDVNTYIRSLSISNFRTLDKLGPSATLLQGQLGAVEGVPVIVSEQMELADTDGKVTDGGNGTDTGRLLLVNRTQWRTGFRRELSIENDRDIQKRQNVMVVSFRIAFMERTGTRSTATHTGLQYDITGVS